MSKYIKNAFVMEYYLHVISMGVSDFLKLKQTQARKGSSIKLNNCLKN